MRRVVNNKRDFWSGVMFTAIGAAFASLAMQYDMGTLAAMGPGWFPVALGGILTALGLLIAFNACRVGAAQNDIDAIGWRELALILLAIGMFALLLPHLGIVIAVVLAVVIAASAGHERRPVEIALAAIALAAICYGIFIRGLGLPLAVWPTFMGG